MVLERPVVKCSVASRVVDSVCEKEEQKRWVD
jgi:hypothetical protein